MNPSPLAADASSAAGPLDAAALDQLFLAARTHAAFEPRPLPMSLLRELYRLASLGPTSMNCQPARFVFIGTEAGRERLLPHLSAGNVAKVRSAPVTVIVARDTRFYEHMPELWHMPHVREEFERQPERARADAVRNTTLTGAYFIMAARALGLACGPMSGFDASGVNKEFFPDGRCEADFLLNLGYAGGPAAHPRRPRLSFEQACSCL
ncbi:malonic semialdehyde reductase [Caldimonas tepidiphila]|uniref:malonic semialdehyde reductase n=1 Tax=Caldimonas tepidiphila TaxID=2315841 RepID=UPI000E5AFDA7|nr:malonic semialdehyde reductase [Caldimonas tepidiphila]